MTAPASHWPTLRAQADRLPIPAQVVDILHEEGWIPRGWDEPVCEPRWVTPSPEGFVEGAWFDVDEVLAKLDAFSKLRHTKTRKWAGRPLRPDPWQIVYLIAPVFGWKHPEVLAVDAGVEPGSRIIRYFWVAVPRRNGKTTVCSGFLLVLLGADGEPGPEVYAAATSMHQAGQLFDPARQMVERSPVLASRMRTTKTRIDYPGNGGFFRVLSSIADAAHGLNVHGAVVDEIHVHQDDELIEAIETGTGSRHQPLIGHITTSDDGRIGTPYDARHNLAVGLAEGRLDPQPEMLAVIYAAPDEADPFDEQVWWNCNPGLGVSKYLGTMRADATKAKNDPSSLPGFCRLHLNQRRGGGAGLFDVTAWREGTARWAVDPEELRRRPGYAALVTSSTIDYAAWVMVFPDRFTVDGGKVAGWWVLPRFWLPEAALRAQYKDMADLIRFWASKGHVKLTPGDVIDVEQIRSDLLRDLNRYRRLEDFSVPPKGDESLRQTVAEYRDNGWGWVCQQSTLRLAGPTKELQRAVGSGAVACSNAVMTWMVGNVHGRADEDNQVKPDPKSSAGNIAGVSGLVTALAAALRPAEHDDRAKANVY